MWTASAVFHAHETPARMVTDYICVEFAFGLLLSQSVYFLAVESYLGSLQTTAIGTLPRPE